MYIQGTGVFCPRLILGKQFKDLEYSQKCW